MKVRWVLFGSLLAALLLAAPAAARASQVYGDFDRDGRQDRVTLDPRKSSVVEVWLSSTRSLRVLRSRVPLTRIGVFDLDGDGHPELVAADSSAGLQVWRGNKQGKLRRYTPRRSLPRARPDAPANVDDEDNPADGPIAGSFPQPAPFDAPRYELAHVPSRHSFSISWSAFLPIDGTRAAVATRGPPALSPR